MIAPAPVAPLRAALLMLASTLSFGLMAISIRLASQSLGTTEIAFFRNAIGLAVLLPMVLRRAGRRRAPRICRAIWCAP